MQTSIFGGLSAIETNDTEFHFANGIVLRKSYAHLFSSFIMAFKPPGLYKHHDGPWKSAKGGIALDVTAEIEVSDSAALDLNLDQKEIIWIIVSLLRLAAYPYASVPVLSNISFTKIPMADSDPIIDTYETTRRLFRPPANIPTMVDIGALEWVKDNLTRTLNLMKNDPKFYSAFKAFDSAAEVGRLSSSLLMLWGAIEQLFSPNTGELKYRVSANLAVFLSTPGSDRLKLFKDISKLYNERSSAAHTSKDIEHGPLIETYVHLRNALFKIIESGTVPTQQQLEALIFQA